MVMGAVVFSAPGQHVFRILTLRHSCSPMGVFHRKEHGGNNALFLWEAVKFVVPSWVPYI